MKNWQKCGEIEIEKLRIIADTRQIKIKLITVQKRYGNRILQEFLLEKQMPWLMS